MRRGTLPEVSNKASFEEQIEFIDTDTSEPISVANTVDIIVTVAPGGDDQARTGYRTRSGRTLVASLLTDGIELSPDGLSFTLRFTRSQMATLSPMTYEIGARIVFVPDENEQQVLLGYLPVLEGL